MMSDPSPELTHAAGARPRRRPWKRVLAALALFVWLPVGFYAAENWRGARAWARVRAELTARGEPLDRAGVVPPPIAPAARNLAMAPLFARILAYETGPDGATRFPRVVPKDQTGLTKAPQDDTTRAAPIGAGGDWQRARGSDLAAWQDYYRKAAPGYFPLPPERSGSPASDVLAALERFGPALDELTREAEERPEARFPLNYEIKLTAGINLPHLQVLQRFTQTLRLRASARLAADQPAGALRDLELGLRLRAAPLREPTMISHLVAQTMTGLLINPLWEGLAARRWNPAELTRLQTALGRADPLAEHQTALRGERAFGFLDMMNYLERNRSAAGFAGVLLEAPGVENPPLWLLDAVARSAPRGWFDQNRATGCELTQGFIEAVDLGAHRVFLDRHSAAIQAAELPPLNATTILARFSVPVLGNTLRASARHAAAVDLAVTACALERCFLECGGYPAALADLAPAYLPRVPTDLIDSAPLRYARTADGRFRLWSIGWDGVDDGGTVLFDDKGRVDQKRGDWVWQYAAPIDAPKSAFALTAVP